MNLLEFIKNNQMVQIILALLVVYLFMKFYNKESLENVPAAEAEMAADVEAEAELEVEEDMASLAQPDMTLAGDKAAVEQPVQGIDSIIAGQAQLTTADLLPVYDEANTFTKENPVSKLLQEQNFLQAGYHMGINTVVQSNKIPYLDIRSAPPIPKSDLGPFLNSSYEEPMGAKRRFLELGA